MSDVSQKFQNLSPEKLELLRRKLQAQQVIRKPIEIISRRTDQSSFIMSAAQKRLWFLDQLDSGSAFYNIPSALRISGRLDVAAMEAAVNDLAARHEILRSYYTVGDGGAPVQNIHPKLFIPLHVVDFQKTPANEMEDRIKQFLADIAATPFDLSNAPLLSATLLDLPGDDYILMLNMHHIIADGWSIGIVLREILAFYAARTKNTQAPLPEPKLQFADYAQWQHDKITSEDLKDQLEYWKNYLRDMPPALEIITDYKRPSVQSHQGRQYKFRLDEKIADGLRKLSKEHNTSLFNTFMAAVQLFFYKFTQQEDFGIGAPIANRHLKEVEDIVGFFVNTIVLRARFEKDIPFIELLRRVKHDILEATEHQDIPFERIVEEVMPHRDLSRSPLFQVMFDLQKAPFKSMRVSGLELQLFDVEINIAKFDLLFLVLDLEGDLECTLEYNTELFKESTIARMAGYFSTLLENIVADPERPISEISLLTRDEERRILVEWNNTTTDYPRNETVQALFEKQAAKRPNNPAVKYGNTILIYSQLNERANKIAHYLKMRGVAPGDYIALYLERSPDMIAAMLGILKAGACYVPLDLAYPKTRLAFMVEDVKAPVLITQRALVDAVPTGDHEILVLDAEEDRIATQSGDNPQIETTPTSPAYVIYTSGSTGMPKGVVVPHRAIIRLVIKTNYIEIGENDHIAQVANAAFDAATFEIWGALLNGAELVVISRDVLLSSKDFVELIQKEKITHMVLTTAYFNQIANEEPNAFSTIDTLMYGGEAADARVVRLVLNNKAPNHLVNVYGPTENTTYSTTFETDSVAPDVSNVPIGKPIANSYHYVLDKYLKPCPVGVPGELYLGGDGLALGYHNRPDLNEQKFINDPYRPNENARLYRSGDLVRYLPDGNVEFLGRIDQQVKIRGFRIELGEIESLLKKNEQLADAVVLAWENKLGEKQLVAYIVPSEDVNISANDLKSYLSDKLPDYMIPTFFVTVDAIPINANGKIDKHALPDPTKALISRENEYIAPRNKLEKYLARVWQEILGVERIGIYDNFFDLGGNSLKAAMFMNKMQKEFNETTHVAAVFKAPRIAEMAVYMAEYYPGIVRKKFGEDARDTTAERIRLSDDDVKNKVTRNDIVTFRNIIRPLPPRSTPARSEKNRKAVFLLSPPRSGSTLLRVMLAGNKHLFSPPELDLLSFNTLGERKKAFTGNGLQIWLQATIRAIMEIKNCDAHEAERLMAEFEAQNLAVKDFYWQLQEWLGNRVLVDKTPTYPFDLEVLRRAEQDFEDARYIHLVRHPYAMIYSFIEAKLDENFFRHEHPFSRRELAELIWIVSNQNILDFLENIPRERRMLIRFEDLLRNPKLELQQLCDFLDIEFQEEMLEPYKGKKMTDGIKKNVQMVGDFKFYLHKDIDADVAEKWKKFHKVDFLSDAAWELANRFHYPEEKNLAQQLRAGGPEKLGRIRKIPRTKELPLSFAQQRLWFLEKFDPGNIQYNIPVAVNLKGPLKIAALEESLNRIVERHETLRTTFKTRQDGKAEQVVKSSLKIPLPVIHLDDIPKALQHEQAQKIADAEAALPFDLGYGPLLRAKLIQLEEEEFVLVIVMHHIVSDGWSVNIFIRELAALYEAASLHNEINLPKLPIQYADFAAWQRNWLSGPRLESQLSFWEKTLGDGPAVLELPTDRPRSSVQEHKSYEAIFQFSKELTAAIKELSQKHGVTLFMTLMAAWQVLMARYANQTDIAVGTPIAGRTRKEIEPLIGFFVNTLVIRSDLSENPTFSDLLMQVKEKALDAYNNQDVPFEKLVDELQPNRDMSHTPLFQTMFALQDSALETIKLSDLTLSVFPISSGAAKFDLSLSMVERFSELRGQLESDAGLFEPSTIKRLVSHFENLLHAIADNPEQHVFNLPIQSEKEQYQILRAWNRNKELVPPGIVLHQAFENQVAKTPEAAAVSDGKVRLSYHQLNEQANRLAHHLRKSGVGPDVLVGVSLERSVQAIIAILAVWKACGAYVPLDPDYPEERLHYILRDADLQYLITQKDVVGKLPVGDQQIFLMDANWPSLGDVSTENPENVTQSEALAYVIYTSGSTGRPKGVMISHHSAYNLLLGLETQIYHRLEQRPLRTSLNAPLLFDASMQQLVTLLRGHQVCIIPADVRTDGAALLDFIKREKIDVFDCVPSQLKLLIEAGLFNEGEWAPQALLPGGEAIDETMWKILRRQQVSQVFNMYGPTECTVDATSCLVTHGPEKPSIGRPLANAEVYILDRYQQPVPIGVIGEICISGDGLSRGYLNRADLTAEKFVPNPFKSSGERLYRTGDLGRFLPDGVIEYIGRLDHQVKLRGYRMELGEIEANLNSHDKIKESVVIVREDAPGDKRLVAYFIPTDGEPPSAPELREFLKPILPEYMIPSYFVALEKFPLTPNGKLDRKALPKPQLERKDITSEYSEAQTEAEKSLTEIWRTVLGVDNVGIDDNFFELGGDSILSIQVIARAQQNGILLSPKQIFEAPTIRDLAANAAKAPEFHAEQGPVVGDAPLTPIQKWFFEQDIPNRNHWNQSLLLKVNEELDPEILKKVTAKIVEHHDALRLRFRPSNEGWKQQIAPLDDSAPFEMIDLSAMPSGAAKALRKSLDEQQRSLDISTGPIVKIVYYRMAANSNRLFIVIHHTAIDGLSWRILLEDIGNLYDALARGEKPELPAKTTSYKYWAEKLYDYAVSDQALAAANAWNGARDNMAIPVDLDNGANSEASSKIVSISLSESETFSLLHEVNPVYRTHINDILLTALVKAFAEWSGEKAVLIDLEGHGRESVVEDANISRTVGWFTTLYPVLLDLSGRQSPDEEIKAVKNQLAAIPRNGIDYGVLKYLAPESEAGKKIAATPQPRIAFNYLGQFNPSIQDVRFQVADEENGTERDPDALRPHQLFISGKIMHEKLHMSFIFSENVHKQETIESFADNYRKHLSGIIEYCRTAKDDAGFSPDIDQSIVDYNELENLLDELG